VQLKGDTDNFRNSIGFRQPDQSIIDLLPPFSAGAGLRSGEWNEEFSVGDTSGAARCALAEYRG
jgi:hypothetical protein